METIKNEVEKTLLVWTNKDVWKLRLKHSIRLFLFICGLALLTVIAPLPTRCYVQSVSDLSYNYGGQPPVNMISADTPLKPGHSATIRDCYPPNRAEFWQNPQWNLEFHWIFAPQAVHTKGTTIHLSYPVDLENNNNLLGASQNVFVGKVVGQKGNKVTQVGPRTQYAVEVATNIKGELGSIVIVDMMGGYENGQLITVESDDPENFLLKPGFSYLFSTRYNEQENWYTLIAHPNARKLLSDDSSATMEDLRTIAKKDEKVQRLQLDYPNEILVDADIANNNVDNSFLSLPPKSKAAAQSRADEAKASLAAEKAQ